MPQFTVYKNKNPASRGAYPFLLDIQSDLLGDLQTRVVVPLTKITTLSKKPVRNLMPTLTIDGDNFLLLIPQLAGVNKADLGAEITNASAHRDQIIAAMDFLITGI